MKKLSTLLTGLVLISSTAFAQSLVNEDFEGTTFPPTGWTSYDEDNRAADPAYIFVGGGWERINLTADGTFQAVNSSAYSPTGASDDWLITPSLSIPSGTDLTFLSYTFARLADQTFAGTSTTEVRVSTTGTAIADFTDVFNITAPANAGLLVPQRLDISQYAGQTIYIAFRDLTNGGLAIVLDDVNVETLPDVAIELASLNFSDIGEEGDRVNITGTLVNRGSTDISDFDVNWTDGSGDNMQTFAMSIPAFSSVDFTHSTRFTAPAASAGVTDITVTVSNPNGVADPDPSDNSLTVNYVVPNGTTTAKNSLLEEYTTARCQFCPDGQLFVEDILAANDNVVAIGVHSCFNTDGMTNSEALDLCNTLGNNSAPSAMVDRHIFPGETSPTFGRGGAGSANSPWNTRARDRANDGAPLSVDVRGSYDAGSGQLSVKVSTSFHDHYPGDIRVALAIVEDSVSNNPTAGYDADWDQVNAYYATAGHPFFGIGVPANQAQTISIINGYIHRHVLRDILPNTWGDESSIPAVKDRVFFTNYDTDFNVTLDAGWDASKVSIVAIVSRFGDGDATKYSVLNSEQVKISEMLGVGIQENENLGDDLKIYPNPSSEITNLKLKLKETADVELTLFDITGKQLRFEDYGQVVAGPQVFRLNVADLANGFYFVNLRIGDDVITRKISVNK